MHEFVCLACLQMATARGFSVRRVAFVSPRSSCVMATQTVAMRMTLMKRKLSVSAQDVALHPEYKGYVCHLVETKIWSFALLHLTNKIFVHM